MPPLLADFTHARPCKPFCEKYLTLPKWTQKKQQIFFGFTASCAAAVRRDGYSVEIKEDGGTLVYRLFTNY